jgi:hypothetical protein
MNGKVYCWVLAAVCLVGCSSSQKATAVETIVATSGALQIGTVNKVFAAPLAVGVADSSGNAVSGALVTFTAPTTGPSGTFLGGENTATVTTMANGSAFASFAANAEAGGPYIVTASVAGSAATASFSLTNTAGTAASITVTSGTPQTAAVNTAYAAPLVVTVLDIDGNPVSDLNVKFTAPATGAGGIFVDSQNNTTTSTTDVNGVASSDAFIANGTAGAYTVTATVKGLATPVYFNLTNTGAVFTFYLNGHEAIKGGGNYFALAGAVAIDANGNVLAGEQDYNDANGHTSEEPYGDTITGGTLTVDSTSGEGTLTLKTNNSNVGVNGTETLGVQFVNSSHALVIQFDGTSASNGSMDLQTIPNTLNGGFSFTMSGVDSNSHPTAMGGVFTISGFTMVSGGLVKGVVDTNDNGTVRLGTTFPTGRSTSAISIPDSFGRGTLINTNIASAINYYIVGPEVMRIIDVDPSDSFVGSLYGQGTGTFSSVSLASSVFGVENTPAPGNNPYVVAGMITSNPSAGTFQGVADDDENGTVCPNPQKNPCPVSISGPYSIGTNGYGSLSNTSGNLGVALFGIYMVDPNINISDPNNNASGLGGALIAELDSHLNGTGVLIPQTDPTTASFTGNYALGAQLFIPNGEVALLGQGSVTGGVLNGAGLLSDLYIDSGNATDSTVTFSGTSNPDGTNVGRYTMSPLDVTFSGGPTVPLTTVIYQASGGQLLWLEEDTNRLLLGSLQQQSATPTPLSMAIKTKLKH